MPVKPWKFTKIEEWSRVNVHMTEIRIATELDAERIVEINNKAWLETYVNEEIGITRELLLSRLTPEKIERRIEK